MLGLPGYPINVDDRWNKISILMDRLLKVPPAIYAAELQAPLIDGNLDPIRNPYSYVYYAKCESCDNPFMGQSDPSADASFPEALYFRHTQLLAESIGEEPTP